jgi:hypothetical protein
MRCKAFAGTFRKWKLPNRPPQGTILVHRDLSQHGREAVLKEARSGSKQTLPVRTTEPADFPAVRTEEHDEC